MKEIRKYFYWNKSENGIMMKIQYINIYGN